MAKGKYCNIAYF